MMAALAILAFVWNAHFGGPTIGDHVLATATATDPSGNVVVTGEFRGTANFGGTDLTSDGNNKDIFLARYTAAGAHSWSMRFGSTGTDLGWGIGTDSSSNVYLVGQFAGTVNFGGADLVTAGNTDIFIAKFTSAGAYVWSYSFGGTGIETGNAISVMADGTFAIAGQFGNFGGPVDFGGGALTSAGGPDIFVAKYTASGAFLWANRIGGISNDFGLGVAIDTAGAVAMTGYFTGTIILPCMSITAVGPTDGLAVKYSTSGSVTWVRRFGGASDDRGVAIAMGPDSETVVTGTFNGTANFGGVSRTSTGGTDIFLVKYLSAGSWSWDAAYGTTSAVGDLSKGVAIDSAGNIALTGSIVNGVNFGGGALCPLCSSYDVFVAEFTGTGTHLWSGRYGDLSDDHGNGVAFDSSGNVIAAGDYFTGINFGGGAMPSPGAEDGFLVKFQP